MMKLFSGGRELPQVALEKIVGYFRRLDCPLYLGYVAVEVGYSLLQAQVMCEALAEAGVIRELTPAEKRAQEIDPQDVIYVLTDRAHLGRAVR